METSSNRNHFSTAEGPCCPSIPMGQDLDRTRQDATRACHCSRFGNLKLSESSSCPTVIYFIDNSVCSLLRKLAGSDTSELGLVTEDQENADLAWYFQYVTTHNRATTPIKANASHSNTLCKRSCDR